jgi:hypothetical protein
MTYAELVQKIRDYTEVDSNVLTSTIVDGIIENAEFRIYRDVDSDNNRRYATANLVASQRFIDTPDNLLIVRSAQIVNGGSGSTRNFLEYRDTSFMSEYNSTGVTGEPKYYGMWDQNTMLNYYYVSRIQDAGAYSNNADVPYRFVPCMVSGLAYYLSQKFKPELTQQMKLLYEDELQRALEEDGSSSSSFITPKNYYPNV